MKKRGQTSFEYLIIVSFITFIVIGILSIALVYSSSINSQIRITQMNNFANKIISTSESVFYAGEPSKTTILVYIPEGLESIDINEDENLLIISLQSPSGTITSAFSSNVDISGSLVSSPGVKKIEVKAESDKIVISQI